MEALGVRFVPREEELVEYLRHHNNGQTLHSFGAINQDIDLYVSHPQQLKDVNENDSNYYYASRKGPSRQTPDGHWRATDGRKPIQNKEGQIVGYKQNLRFYLRQKNSNSTNWVMTEYTLPTDTSHDDTLKAICVIRRTAGNQRNEICQASTLDATNQRLPGSETWMGSSSFPNYTNLPDFLIRVANYLDVNYELPSEFNNMT